MSESERDTRRKVLEHNVSQNELRELMSYHGHILFGHLSIDYAKCQQHDSIQTMLLQMFQHLYFMMLLPAGYLQGLC